MGPSTPRFRFTCNPLLDTRIPSRTPTVVGTMELDLDMRTVERNYCALLPEPRDVDTVWRELLEAVAARSCRDDDEAHQEDGDEMSCDSMATQPLDEETNQDGSNHPLKQGLTALDLQAFADVLDKVYKRGVEFDVALFHALRDCLCRRQLIQACSNPEKSAKEPIVFIFKLPDQDASGRMYAIGIARQAEKRRSDEGESDKSSSESECDSEAPVNTKLNHCSCLLEKEQGDTTWTVIRYFSFVAVRVGYDGDGYEAIPQLLKDTIQRALPSRAEVGELDYACWAAIIGKYSVPTKETMEMESDNEVDDDETMEIASDAEDEVTSDNKVEVKKAECETSNDIPAPKFRWLSGNVFVPEKCGCRFRYEATDCVDSVENDDGVSIKTAISVYLEVLLSGLRAARQLLDAILSNIIIRPVPTSGRKVMFSKTELLDMELRGKPNFGKRIDNDDPNADGHWVVSQGEIFTGKINFYDFSRQLGEEGFARFFFFKEDGMQVDVVVKVCSMSIHGSLIRPSETWQSLWSINSEYKKEKLAGGEKWDLFNVLFAADNASNGLVTIMADLSMDYKILTPEHDDLPFHVLWSAFQDLVSRILLPLADLYIIHPDLRPGWDVTANILFTREILCPSNKPAMQIIDFESLVNIDDWDPPYCKSPYKYIRRGKEWSSHTFLWWQCIRTAFAWKMKRKQMDMEETNVKTIMLEDTSEWSIMLGKEFCVSANEVDMNRSHVEGCLAHLNVILCDQTEA